MNSTMNNTISMIIITVGVALCAAFGARLPEQTTQRQVKIKKAINQAEEKAKLEAETKVKDTAKAEEEKKKIISEAKAKAEAQAKKDHPAAPPTKRLSAWWSLAGLPFSAGCVLIVAGALLARREERLSHHEDKKEGGAGSVDLGVLLEDVHQRTSALHQRCAALQDPKNKEAVALRDALQELLRGDLERVIEARGKVRVRYGVASFAELYGAVSQGERRMNRAWSALVDQHIPEATTSLEGAVESLAEATERLKTLKEG